MPSPKVSPQMPADDKCKGDTFEDNFSSIKVNIKKPKAGISGNRNWFDGFEDGGQTLEGLQHPETLRQAPNKKPQPQLGIDEIMSQGNPPLQITSRKSSFSHNSQRTAPYDRKLSFRLDSPQDSTIGSPSISRPPEIITGSPQAKSIHSSTSSRGPRPGMDLQVDSFLELSSSEGEDNGGSPPSETQDSYSGNCIRGSVKRNSHNGEVFVGDGRRARPVRPRSTLDRNPSRPLSKRSISSGYVPPVPRIPDKPRLNQRTSSTRWREIMEEKAASTESTVDSGASSLNDNAVPLRSQTSLTRKMPHLRGSKLMKVTSEEEKLLEAMRDKRASIRQDDFEKGFKTAMQLQDIVARPKTSGADGRTSRSSTVYGSKSSISPPPQEHRDGRHLNGARLSASVDDLLLDDAYPFPEVPPRESREGMNDRAWLPLGLRSPAGFVSPPKASPSPSFGPSDILPSTPTSRDSPLTPPPGHSSLGYGRGSTLSPPRGVMTMNRLGHDRKRTVSSSVVMLDGVEQQARQLDEESWVMDQW